MSVHRCLTAGAAWLAACGAATGFGQHWKSLGPAPINGVEYSGRIAALVCHPADPNTYWAGAADGGVWRTNDGGQSWTPLTDDLPTTAIGALALDPTNPDILYAGSGEANFANHSRYGLGVFKSIDGGETWTVLASETFRGRCFSSLIVDPSNPQRLLAGVTRAGGFPALSAAKGIPGATGPVGVFESLDGGATWSLLEGGLPARCATSVVLDPLDPDTAYAGIGDIFGDPANGIYKTSDGGAAWIKLASGLPASVLGRVTVSVAPSDPQRVYALLTNPADASGGGATMIGLYRSDDAGATWTLQPLTNIQATYGWYLSVIGVHPNDPDHVLAGGVPLRRSLNGGQTWQTNTPPHVDLHAIMWDAAGRLVVGDDGGVHRSPDSGASWESLNDGLGTIQFYTGVSGLPASEDSIVGGTQDNGTNLRDAEGSWEQILGGDGGWTQVDPTNAQRLFAEFQGTGNIYRSLNGGDTFLQVRKGINLSDRNCFLPPYVIDPQQPNRMFYATHRVYRTTDGANNWVLASGDVTNGPPAAIRALALSPIDSGLLFAATTDGIVARSLDGGNSFVRVREDGWRWPRVTRELALSRRDVFTLLLATGLFGTDQVLRSTDLGTTWQSLDGDLPDVPVNVVALDERATPAVIYAGADDGVYRSINDGATWRRLGAGLPRAAVVDVRPDELRGLLIAATQGRGAWTIPMNIPGDVDSDCDVDDSDLGLLLARLGQPVGADNLAALADLDGDGAVDSADLAELIDRFGAACRFDE